MSDNSSDSDFMTSDSSSSSSDSNDESVITSTSGVNSPHRHSDDESIDGFNSTESLPYFEYNNNSDVDMTDEELPHISPLHHHLPSETPFFIRQIYFADTIDSAEERNRFINRFESLYGTTHPVFYRGSYNQALDEAKRDLKFLLVYLHSEQHEDTEQFCRTVIISQRFIDFLIENNLLFWSASVSSADGYRVSQQLRESTYPYLALIVVKQNRMVVVQKFEGKTPIETLLTELKLSIEDNESGLRAARLERQERNMNQMLRKQQDEAFAESLKADQEKERKKLEEKNKKEAEEKAKKDKELEESRRKDRLLQLRDALVHEIPSEPESKDPNATKLVMKLPNGTRLERRFLKSQSIKYLYYFVFCNKQSPLNFQIRTNFPPRDLPAKPPQPEDFAFKEDNTVECVNPSKAPTFEECDLGKGAMLFVHDLEA